MKKSFTWDYCVPLLTKTIRIMKITTFLLMVAICSITASTYAQSFKVTIQKQNSTIIDILKEIEGSSEFTFFFNNNLVDINKKVSVNVKNGSLEELLTQVLKNTGYSYEVIDRQVLIKQKNTIDKIEKNIIQQATKITGIIVSETGEAIIGANVMIKGTSNGTVTDMDGKFSLNAGKGSILEISFLGYVSQQILVKNENTIRIILKEDSKALDEVVVVGYGVQKKVNLSGAVATVATKTLENRPVVNVGQALQGSVANMNVSIGSGKADESPSFNIRGTTSLNGGTPLIIIDGIVSDKDQLNRMNPSDIENVSVLKDAASSAIYGSRAAFGVILVTTKSGKNEKLTINYNNNIVMRTITRMPEIVTDPYLIATTRNTMSAPWYNLYNEEQLAYAKKRSEDPDNTDPYFINPDGTYSYFGTTDWMNEAFKNTGFSTIHSMDISGKTDRLSYYLSGNYNFQDGMVKYGTDKYNRYNIHSKLNFELTKWWSVGNNTNFVTSDYDYLGYMSTAYREINRKSPMDVPLNPDGTWTATGASVLGRLRDGGRNKKYDTNLSTQFTTKVEFIKDILFVNGNFAYTSKNIKNNGYSIPVTYYNGPDLPARYYDEVSSAWGDNANVKHLLFDVYGTFQKTFNKKHSITTLVGFNQEEYRYDIMSASRKELISNSLPSINLGTGDMNVGQTISTWALRGSFARFNYTFDDKYIVEFNGRYDGTSRFPETKRFAFNPSGSLAWVVSKENFFEPLQNVVSFLKVRGSYGSLGNQDVSDYAYLATMGSGKTSQILDGKQPVYVSAPGLVSGNLTWEKVITQNIGLDINFLNNKLTVSADAYIRRTLDMLTAGSTLPGVLGTSVPKENAADLKTKGWELTLGWKDQFKVAGKPLQYNVNFNLADSRAWITKFANKTGSLDDYYVGQQIGEIWGVTTQGFFTSEDDIKNHADQLLVTSYPGTRPLAPGDLKFEDRDNNGKIDWGKWTTDDHGDYHVIGNNRARFTFGFSTSAEWNGFDLSLFVQGVGKKDYMPGTGDLFFWGIYAQPWTNVTVGNYSDRWTEETPNAYFPRFKSYVAEQGSKEAGLPQTRYLQNAAYARLKNLTFGYTLPKQLTHKVGVDRLRIFFSGDNLGEISGLYKNYKVDPETLGNFTYPFQRSYSFGLNVTF